MNSSNVVSILDPEASFDNGVGGGGAGGYKRTPKVLIYQISGQTPTRFGHRCFDTLFSIYDEWDYCRNMSEFDFFFSKIHMKIFFVWLPKKVLIIFERRIFRVNLSKFGQKSFAPPRICMPLHLVVSRPISASLSVSKVSGLISAAIGLGLKPIVLRLWIPQWYDLVKLFNSTTSKLKIFLSAVSADKK